jgi:hypothetical protein
MPAGLWPAAKSNQENFSRKMRKFSCQEGSNAAKAEMPRVVAALVAIFAFASLSFFLSGCGSIATAPAPSSSVKLTPHPPHIYVAPFDTSTARWVVGREGIDLVVMREDFQTQFSRILANRLNKLAPTEQRWQDDLPDHGWMVGGEFITVDQGSRFLRASIGDGFGATTLQTQVYVYDLSISKTQYLLSFRTGVPNPATGQGSGSGNGLSGLSAGGEPVSTAFGIGSGLKQDTTHTVDDIAAVLAQYL